LRGLGKRFPGVRENLSPHRSKINPSVGAFQEGNAKLVFQLANLAAERRLAYVACFRCPAEMTVFGEGNQIAKILKIHSFDPKCSSLVLS
jgi:superfamily I DNA/RNA helicase